MNKVFHFELMGDTDKFYCYIKIVGKLSHDDYQKFIPLFEDALNDTSDPKVKLLIDITELTDWDMEAVWDDIKFGITHNQDFEKIALIGDCSFYKYGVKIADWFTHYKMKYFADEKEAVEWLRL